MCYSFLYCFSSFKIFLLLFKTILNFRLLVKYWLQNNNFFKSYVEKKRTNVLFSFSLEITSFLTPKRISFLENRNLNGLWVMYQKQLQYVYFITIYQLKMLYYNAVEVAFNEIDIFYVTCHTLSQYKAFWYSVIFTSSAIYILLHDVKIYFFHFL